MGEQRRHFTSEDKVQALDEADRTIPGQEKEKCLLRDVDDTRLELRGEERTMAALAGKIISLRFHLRDARIYAVWTGPAA